MGKYFKVTRRQFIRLSTIAGSSLLLAPRLPGFSSVAHAAPTAADPRDIKFKQNLRGVGPGGIPVAVPDGVRKYDDIVADHYTIDINEFKDQIHPNLGATSLWGYNPRNALGVAGVPTQKHLGGIIIGEKGRPIQITFQNNLPNSHILPVDTTIMGADGAQNRVSVHLHGGEVPWMSDGGPFAWFDPKGGYGPSAQKGSLNIFKVLNKNLKPGQGEYYYPNKQSARFVWYHDHAVGITRLNAYAGIASALIIRDNFERKLVKKSGLPDFIENGGREIPLVIQEKLFLETDTPNFPGSAKTAGSLAYPYTYNDPLPNAPSPVPPVSAVPEMFGDTMLANGTVYPKAAIEPRRYRLRVLNATQARFLNLQLYVETAPGSGLPDFNQPGPDFLVIGTEGGFLAKPTLVPSGKPIRVIDTDPVTGDRTVDPANPGGSLITGPAERWDIIIDFKKYAGKSLILYNDAPAPFPMGGAENDGPGVNGVFINQTIMRFDVAAKITGAADPPLEINPNFDLSNGIDNPLTPNWSLAPQATPKGAKVRRLTLNELLDDRGRLIQMLGTNMLGPAPMGTLLPPGVGTTFAMGYIDPATETPNKKDVEVWEIANLTADTHPMHFHLVNVQVLWRRPFNPDTYNGTPAYTGPARGPDPTELGWKDTVKMNPGEVTAVLMRFKLPAVPFEVPPSPRTGDNEYVWHCHILEHEEHDMMRPLIVKGRNPQVDE
jgi:spore coat protein A